MLSASFLLNGGNKLRIFHEKGLIVYFIMREEGSKGIDKILFLFFIGVGGGVGVFFTKSILVHEY